MKKLSALSAITVVSARALCSSALAADVATVNIAGVTGKKPHAYVDDDGNCIRRKSDRPQRRK